MLRFFKKKTEDLSDTALIQAYSKHQNMLYLGQLFERYNALIYGVCLKYLKNETEAEDAFMQVFEKLSKKIPQQEIKNFKSWLHVLVKNHCLEILRQKKKHLTVSYESDLMQNEPFLHPFEEQETEAQFKQLDSCLQQLDSLQQECIQLFYFEKKSYKEIAAFQQLPLGKIRSFIQNGRRNLKICIEGFRD